jgi:hypothetical protein
MERMVGPKEDGWEARRQRGRYGETDPLTSGAHLSGRTKKLAETVLALILGRDVQTKEYVCTLHTVLLNINFMAFNLWRKNYVLIE